VITYCSNIHPGESFQDTFSNLRAYLPAIKETVSPTKPFPIGLRLSNQAAMEAGDKAVAQFREWCDENGFFVPTINGFPYGPFSAVPVKENAYLPDWRYSERVAYTKQLATLLDSWLPPGITGNISTVPGGFRKHIKGGDYPLIRQNIILVLEWLDRLKQKSGKEILLTLEPEPRCTMETTQDTVAFFERMAFPEDLRKSLGVCYDCCHQAVEFEDPRESLSLLAKAQIKIGKVQVSSALRLKNFDRAVFEKFCEPSYLHQVVIRGRDGSLTRFSDLPEALGHHRRCEGEEWRIHFHVPVFLEKIGSFETTRFFLEEILPLVEPTVLLEVETYSWHVLPPELQMDSVTHSIIRELQWVRSQIHETDGSS